MWEKREEANEIVLKLGALPFPTSKTKGNVCDKNKKMTPKFTNPKKNKKL